MLCSAARDSPCCRSVVAAGRPAGPALRPPWRPSSSAPSLTPSSGKARHGKFPSLSPFPSPSSSAFLIVVFPSFLAEFAGGFPFLLPPWRVPAAWTGPLDGPPLPCCSLRSPPTCRCLGIRELPGGFLLKFGVDFARRPCPENAAGQLVCPYRTTPFATLFRGCILNLPMTINEGNFARLSSPLCSVLL